MSPSPSRIAGTRATQEANASPLIANTIDTATLVRSIATLTTTSTGRIDTM